MHAGRVRSLAVAVSLLLAASAPVLAAPGIACAATGSGGPHAALVVDTGESVTSYCVALDASSVDGMRLIELASEQYGLAYRLGFGGRAVCMLSGVGATGDDCFGDYPNFWGYFHGTGSSDWAWATGSAADHQVADGDREAWSWGTGDSGTTHGVPPATSIDDACGAAPEPQPSPSPATPPDPSPTPGPASAVGSPGPGSNAGGSNGGASNGGGSSGDGSSGDEHSGGSPHSPSPEASTSASPPAAAPTSPAPDVVRAAAASPPGSSGPPLGGLLAVGAMASLGIGGWFIARRRRAGG